jgi:O-antigen ligase
MALKTIIFLAAFAVACGGALAVPVVGIVGYILHYHIWPETQWWGEGLGSLGIRFSFSLAACLAIGTVLHWRQLQGRSKLLVRHEWLLILFVAVIWLSGFICGPVPRATRPPNEAAGGAVGAVSVAPGASAAPATPEAVHGVAPAAPDGEGAPAKMTKVIIFALILTHVATSFKRLEIVLWAIIVGVIGVGLQALTAGEAAFKESRLNLVGGPDFCESNGLAMHLAAAIPIIAIMFMKSSWRGKLVCLVAGVLAVDAITMTRSRGAFVGLAGGMVVALIAAPRGNRKYIVAGMIAMIIGGLYLTDKGFWSRMETIQVKKYADESGLSRMAIWAGSLELIQDHPLGVGAGNFPAHIGKYVPQHPSRDAHNTYVLCYSELGVQGLVLYLVILGSALLLLRRVYSQLRHMPSRISGGHLWLPYGIALSLIVFAINGFTTSRLYSEAPWWFLAMPVCLIRCMENAHLAATPAKAKRRSAAVDQAAVCEATVQE